METYDFSTPRRMGASAFVIIFLKQLRSFLYSFITIIIMIFINEETFMDKFLYAGGFLAAVVGLALITGFVKYYFQKFHIEEGNLIFYHGVISRDTTSIPLSKVHSMRTIRGFVYRLLGLRGISFDTLASEGKEVELILDESDWQLLYGRLSRQESCVYTEGESSSAVVASAPLSEGIPATDRDAQLSDDNTGTLRISDRDIIIGALCQNHLKGFVVLGTIVLAVADKFFEIFEDHYDEIAGFIETEAGNIRLTPVMVLTILAVTYLAIAILWTTRTFLRYSHMTITFDRGFLAVTSGLISRFSNRIFHDKVSSITIKQNPLERIAGATTIHLHQALNTGDKENGNGIRIYGSNDDGRFLDWWLGTDRTAASPVFPKVRSGRGLFYRVLIPNLAVAAAIFIAAWWADMRMLAIWGAGLYAALSASRAYMRILHSHVCAYPDFLEIGGGYLAETHSYIKYGDIESVKIRQTPFTPRFGRVTLRILTNGDAFSIPSIPLNEAGAIFNFILARQSHYS